MPCDDGPEVFVAAPDSFSAAEMFDLGIKLGDFLHAAKGRLSGYEGCVAVVIVDPRTGEAPAQPKGCAKTLHLEFEDGTLRPTE